MNYENWYGLPESTEKESETKKEVRLKLYTEWGLNPASDLPIPLYIPKGKKKPGDKELLELDKVLFGEDPAQLNSVSVLKSPSICHGLNDNPERGKKPVCKICDNMAYCPTPNFISRFKELNKQNGMDYLKLRIDLKATDEDIIKEIKRELFFYRQFIVKDKSRKSDPEYNPWDIWDHCKIHGKNPLQLAKVVYLQGGGNPDEDLNPTYNKAVKNIYDKILDAYNKADEMIKRIDIKRE